MHPANCKCSVCTWEHVQYERFIPSQRSYVIVANNLKTKNRFAFNCSLCGGRITPTSNYGVYEIIGNPENEPSFLTELCSEECMNLWRLKNAHYPIEFYVYDEHKNYD